MDTNGHKNDKTVITTKYTKHTKYGNSVTPSHEKRYSCSFVLFVVQNSFSQPSHNFMK